MGKYIYQELLRELQHVEHELKELDRRYTSLSRGCCKTHKYSKINA
ncbi:MULTISPECIES: hypothetical protein [Bacillus cereus group]|nr:hypothetical protein [Bacillus thuringiensis]